MGLCDAGKTLVFSRLLYNRHIHTHTSVKENIGELVVNNVSKVFCKKARKTLDSSFLHLTISIVIYHPKSYTSQSWHKLALPKW